MGATRTVRNVSFGALCLAGAATVGSIKAHAFGGFLAWDNCIGTYSCGGSLCAANDNLCFSYCGRYGDGSHRASCTEGPMCGESCELSCYCGIAD